MGKKYCEICTKKCKSFAIRIDDNVYVHSDCFRCNDCREELELSKFYFKNKRLYCIKDFKKMYFPKCVKCLQVIEEEMVKVMGQQYHVKCLCCSFCKATSKHGDKLNFDGKNLTCRECTLISLRIQSINNKSSEYKTPDKEFASMENRKETTEVLNSTNHELSTPLKSKPSDNKDGNVVSEKLSSPLTSKPPIFPTTRPRIEKMTSPQVQSTSSSSPWNSLIRSSRTSSPSNDDDYRHTTGGSYLDRPLNFKKGPSFNVSRDSGSHIHHFHLPEHVEGMQKFSRIRSRTLPKTSVFKPRAREDGIGKLSGTKSPVDDSGVHSEEMKSVSPDGKTPQRGDKDPVLVPASSRETLTKTPLACISEDVMSLVSHASTHLPSKGYSLKPGYGLRPIMYAFYGTSPDSKQHIYSGAISMEDSKDTKSISFGSDCYGSFHSAEEEEKLDPYTGLKRNRSIRSTVSYDPRLSRSRTLMEVISSKRPITVSQFLKKVEQTDGDKTNVKKYSYKDLKIVLSSQDSRLLKRDHLEDHLFDEEFEKIFMINRGQFQLLPEWKKMDLKKKHQLY